MNIKKKNKNKHVGSSFDDFLKKENIIEEVNINALKSILAHLLQQEMESSQITHTVMAQRLGTSRAGLKRLLDPTNYSITLLSLNKVATVLGKKIKYQNSITTPHLTPSHRKG